MGEADRLFGQEHVERYRETGGEVGHDWNGASVLLLTTTGRQTGEPYTTPLIYGEDDGEYVVIASKGGAADHPDWYYNLEADPQAQVQVWDDVMDVKASTVSGDRRERLWDLMTEQWPDYDEYAEKTDREIPVVVLTPR
ncbi:MAG: nitroreductase family deazaflavin-dependent oxidoreductase [Nitriliruptorales bacterium]|nr:nitroreductase family deazaflavin-dependent oxidoreductase [Nitriliruptorales bacterium]